MSNNNQNKPQPAVALTSFASIRRESLLRTYGHKDVAARDGPTARSWMNFGAFVGLLTPAYTLMMRSIKPESNSRAVLLTGLTASAGFIGFSFLYKYQAAQTMKGSKQWHDLYKEATAAEQRNSEKDLESLLEKKSVLETKYNYLTNNDLFYNAKKHIKEYDQNPLFDDPKEAAKK